MLLAAKKVLSPGIRWADSHLRLVTAARQGLAFGLLAVLPLDSMAGQFVAVTAALRSTSWMVFGVGPVGEYRYATNMVRCVVGTDGWYVEEDLGSGGKVEYLFTGTNILEHFVLNDKSSPQGRTTEIHSSPSGRLVGQDKANVVWLAYCSGPYLKQSARLIPLPVQEPWYPQLANSDRTVAFNDNLGLPKSADLYGTNGACVCHYEVLQSTNFLGWTFPSRFKVTQSGGPGEMRGGPLWSSAELVLFGQLTSIEVSAAPEIPAEPK